MNRDCLEEDWFLVLNTFERAMNLVVSRSDEENEWTRSISACFCRLAQFSSCLSVDSLESFLRAVCLLYKADDDSSAPDMITESKSTAMETFSKREVGKVSFFHRGVPTDSSTKNLRSLGWSFYDHAHDKIVSTKLTKIRESLRTLPFSLILLSLSIIENSFRIETYFLQIVEYLNELMNKSELSEIRLFSLDMVSNLSSLGLSISRMPGTFPGIVSNKISSIEDLFKISINPDLNSPQDYVSLRPSRELLIAPLCDAITRTKYREIAEACLTSINSILEVAGHDLSPQAWVSVIDALATASGGLRSDATHDVDRTLPSWAPICNIAFRSLKLIVDGEFFLDWTLGIVHLPHCSYI